MMHAIEMSSGAMIYTPSFINMFSGIEKLMGGIQRHTDISLSLNWDGSVTVLSL
jgi:hypothetical protein